MRRSLYTVHMSESASGLPSVRRDRTERHGEGTLGADSHRKAAPCFLALCCKRPQASRAATESSYPWIQTQTGADLCILI
jgi:hypothetical protein